MIEEKFEDVFSFDNIYRGHIKGRLSKRDKRSLVRFEIGMLRKLYDIYDKIQNDKFKIDKYNSFIISEPKKREIQTLHYSQRVVQHVLCDDVLSPYFSKLAIQDNCVCQKGKGMHFALARFEKNLKKFVHDNGQNGYVLKCDILKYFPSLSHRVLKKQIADEIKDKRLKELVENIIESYHTKNEFLQRYNIPRLEFYGNNTGRGVPIGNQTSQVFGMFYLNKLDRIIKEKFQVKIYSRYMDDFIIVHKDKAFLQKLHKEILKILQTLDLKLNSRTQIFPLKNGLTYLGFRYQVSATGKIVKKVSQKTARRFKRRARLLEIAYTNGFINKDKVLESLQAYHGHLMHGNCFQLEKKVSQNLKKQLINGEKMDKEQMNMFEEKNEEEIKRLQNKVGRKEYIIEELSSPKEKQKDMAVITHAKKLCEYIFVITEKSPKKFRWSIVARLQNYSSQIIDFLYQANFEQGDRRLAYQTRANVYLNMLDFYSDTAKNMQAINSHQNEVIAKQIFETQKLLAGWIKSTKK